MEKNISIENIQKEVSLTKEAQENRKLIDAEIGRRQGIGLLGTENLSPSDRVLDYLERVKNVDNFVYEITEELVKNREWKIEPKMVLTIPVVGIGGQEEGVIVNTLINLSNDPMVKTGEVGILILVNRPAGSMADETNTLAKESIEVLGLNGLVMDADIPKDLGTIDGPFANEMAITPNEAPIGILRDILNISAMKLWKQNKASQLPIFLQMDGDFEGFAIGGFEELLGEFNSSKTKLVQCTSDWDSKEFPTENDWGLWIGSELMRELPQIIKSQINNANLSNEVRNQLIFGEAIQRGIQVPQAERMESVAGKGGYGLQRLKEDELDQNIRISERVSPGGVRTTDNLIFKWSNRRAVRSWIDLRQPPISQWVNGFAVDDLVRGETPKEKDLHSGDIELAINLTLARFPIPKKLEEVYDNYQVPILEVLERYGLEIFSVSEEKKREDLFYLQIKMV
ncbi:hypothetical protein AUJ42_00145 [Candidatus Collierbacteria bacterium CG1_02_44_10]|uniref:Uncharacterized protein n=3 Tax=Candidatus Collieribacteriota TaxID=1752725 RepID=A0A2H0DUK5_9BACT|nr:hypothetical protein [bacterium]OIN92760.1 MAG: hypothetical protein AUJ42_00145 [Candidatus Collierbacteria bacterium CG1_02_44_10]PIP85834.1 MAG: hypothetical protein COW83_02150 [Candidatus Collierbacteria bacterium CG22_combo_CG10-13_8_21_14_all_43_12]PIR99816.1 MAG: hypothetical protein COT86_01940 [Candidatus Collierbacteria bacterium CG10_big_fil_rev_8_21_14_0_10_43_36]